VRQGILDNVDRVIFVLPFLSVLDVISTFYVASLGFSPALYQVGFLARYFVSAGFTYVYIVVYLLSVSVVASVLWHIKNRKLNSSLFDKIILLLVIGVAYYIYVRLTATFVGNFMLPFFASGRLSEFSVNVLVYSSTSLALGSYLWRDVVAWMRRNGREKE
jgi:hypothetical protein